MKKLLVVLCAGTLALGSCKKDATTPATLNTVSTDYKAFIVEFTATWCPYCGTNAYPVWDPTFEAHKYKVTGLSLHPADGLVNSDYPEFADFSTFYNCGGYPTTGYNSTGGGYPSAGYFDAPINSSCAANAQAKAGIGLTKSISGNTMTVTTKTVFFSDLTGKYNLAVYLTEDNLVYDQTTTTTTIPNAHHNHLFRGAAGHHAFGTTIVSTATTKGTKMDGTYTIDIPSDVVNRDNLHVVVVLWQVDAAGNPVTTSNAVINSNSL